VNDGKSMARHIEDDNRGGGDVRPDAHGHADDGLRDLMARNDRLADKNHALAEALTRAGAELNKAKAQLGQMAQPPMTFGTMVRVAGSMTDAMGVRHASAEIVTGMRRIVVPVAANVNIARLACGATVMLNESMVLVEQRGVDDSGAIRQIRQVLGDGRLVVADASGNAMLVRRAARLESVTLSPLDRIIVDASSRIALEVLPSEDVADLVLEETPDVTFDDIGGLQQQIGRIRDAVQLPFVHRRLFERYGLKAPKGVLLYGPPGNGKTLIAKAVAHALAQGNAAGSGVFLSVKGPELLNKFVGESERLIRMIFRRARERAASGRPVIVFIDEMDSLLRTRGSGVSSDVETTIVPQFLTELDGVESLDNVMVIGASNRIDMIDPAILRPGRLDVKIRVDRPDREQAVQILRHYLTDDLPRDPGVDVGTLVEALGEDIYRHDETRHIADLGDDRGGWTRLYLSEIVSGAMLKNVVDRAKTKAVKASIESGRDMALAAPMLAEAVEDEYRESAAAIRDVDPVQWSRVNNLAGGHAVALRPAGEERR
jgi:proteasome-associated ATPase